MYLILDMVAASKTVGSYLSEYLPLWLKQYTNSVSKECYHVSYTSHGSCVKMVGSYLKEYLLLWFQHYTNSDSEEYYHVSHTCHCSCVKKCRVILK